MVSKADITGSDFSTEKKRRKTSVTNLIEGGTAFSKASKQDVYMLTVSFEEEEAKNRISIEDTNLFHSTCKELRCLFAEIARTKLEINENAKVKIERQRIEGSLAFVLLKKINRLDKVRIRDGRDALQKEKLRVDSNRLQLQNLLYEAEHLKREVKRCYLFKSQDEEIDLISVEEFYQRAPTIVSRVEKTKHDDHARRIARLEWELQQRKELDAHLKELQSMKAAVQNDIVAKTIRLESLAPRLQELLIATRPLQEALEMPIENGWAVQKTVRLLPQPLYLLYANVTAYGEACDNFLHASIEGDEEEAKQMEIAHTNESGNCIQNENGLCDFNYRCDSDNDENEQDQERRGLKKRRHRGQSKTNSAEQYRERLFKPHPLSVILIFRSNDTNSCSSSGPELALTFFYLPNMHVVTVKCSLIGFKISGIAAGDVLSVNSILNELFPGDSGEESPNPKTKYQLQQYELEYHHQIAQLFKEKALGKPFCWAQEICGLEFISTVDITNCIRYTDDNTRLTRDTNVQSKTIPSIISTIRNRWEARLKLYKQIHDLESKLVNTSVNDERGHLIRISSSLLQWSSISFDDYVASRVATQFLEDGVATMNDLYFRAIVIRGSAKLECYICVSCRFPENSPLWSLSLNWNGKHTAACNSSVRDMEYWCNTISALDYPSDILPMQLKRTMSCLDVYLETDGPYYTPAEFMQDKSFLKPFRGRSRAKPFRIAPNGNNALFTQI